MQISFSNKFCKLYIKTPNKIKQAFKEKLLILETNKNDQRLNNHQLSGKFSFIRSINVTGDWRALFIDNATIIYFILIGKHSNLYK